MKQNHLLGCGCNFASNGSRAILATCWERQLSSSLSVRAHIFGACPLSIYSPREVLRFSRVLLANVLDAFRLLFALHNYDWVVRFTTCHSLIAFFVNVF